MLKLQLSTLQRAFTSRISMKKSKNTFLYLTFYTEINHCPFWLFMVIHGSRCQLRCASWSLVGSCLNRAMWSTWLFCHFRFGLIYPFWLELGSDQSSSLPLQVRVWIEYLIRVNSYKFVMMGKSQKLLKEYAGVFRKALSLLLCKILYFWTSSEKTVSTIIFVGLKYGGSQSFIAIEARSILSMTHYFVTTK